MAANKLRQSYCQVFNKLRILKTSNYLCKSQYCTEKSKDDEFTEKVIGFASFYFKQKEFLEEPETETSESTETFASLLRKSKFIDLGDPAQKLVSGTIFHVVDNDLYIDFGWKFHTVCPRPNKNQNLYLPGAKVRLLVKDLELSTRFLGGTTDITLQEADCVLLGLEKS